MTECSRIVGKSAHQPVDVALEAAVVKCVGYVHYAVGCVSGRFCAFVAVSDGMCCNLEEDLHIN